MCLTGVCVCACDAIDFSWNSIKMLNNYTERVYVCAYMEAFPLSRTLTYVFHWFYFPSLVLPFLHDFRSHYEHNQFTFHSAMRFHRHEILTYICNYRIVHFVFDSTHKKYSMRVRERENTFYA